MEGWWCRSARVIAWLRGDPDSIRVVRSYSPILEPQGYSFILPEPGASVYADVAVMPIRGAPEYRAYNKKLIRVSGFIYDRDPEVALFKALSYPRSEFLLTTVGVDPGRRCGLVVVADGIVLDMVKIECEGIGGRVRQVLGKIPSIESQVYIGDGPGFIVASSSLEAYGISYTVMEEKGTSTYNINPWRMISRDRDIIASLRIAYMGAYGGGVNNRVPKRRRGKENRGGTIEGL